MQDHDRYDTPGINNPTGIEAALSMGLTLVKFFPAEVSGGLEMIKCKGYADIGFSASEGRAQGIGLDKPLITLRGKTQHQLSKMPGG